MTAANHPGGLGWTVHPGPPPEPDDTGADDPEHQPEAEPAAGGRRPGRLRLVAAHTARRAAKAAPGAAGQASDVLGGGGSPVGLLVGALALVLLFVLLQNAKGLSAAFANMSGWLARFVSPYHPLIG